MQSRWNRIGCSLSSQTWRHFRSKAARPAVRELSTRSRLTRDLSASRGAWITSSRRDGVELGANNT